ncbi:MAG TPA: hypothetical protein HA252_06945 [Candidatus Diapherotrites archaeon]|uniref:Uncharacterized protein n=1 Tax=Candidatus Iainarchaeum sp. TaxID=3101447 RepID=A0A7J4JH80_9ARCH|nr:hypothetical protein [Candidatus Diapherotrites archaeon]HIH17113.1 hypothetical protein [Candidatus Diapherotrites archaeon]
MAKSEFFKALGILASLVTVYRGITMDVPMVDTIIIVLVSILFFALAAELKVHGSHWESPNTGVEPGPLPDFLKTSCPCTDDEGGE